MKRVAHFDWCRPVIETSIFMTEKRWRRRSFRPICEKKGKFASFFPAWEDQGWRTGFPLWIDARIDVGQSQDISFNMRIDQEKESFFFIITLFLLWKVSFRRRFGRQSMTKERERNTCFRQTIPASIFLPLVLGPSLRYPERISSSFFINERLFREMKDDGFILDQRNFSSKRCSCENNRKQRTLPETRSGRKTPSRRRIERPETIKWDPKGCNSPQKNDIKWKWRLSSFA